MSIHWTRIFTIGLLVLSASTLSSWAQPESKEAAVEIRRLGYSIQIGAFARYENAERLAAKLQDQGIDAYFFKKDDGVFAVRFGDYSTRSQARQAAKALAVSRIIESYYITAPVAAPLPSAGSTAPANASKPAPKSSPQPKQAHELGEVAARTAERFVGIPYKWGGNTVVEGLDCSAFVKAVYYLCGINIPRTSAEQFKAGKMIPENDLADGDLVFFGHDNQVSHVGIYVGNGRFVHAPQRNDEIKVAELQKPGFSKRFLGARRFF
jgi:gamma-D-glutamyl-L-lysine dipeptidyl-peptidase